MGVGVTKACVSQPHPYTDIQTRAHTQVWGRERDIGQKVKMKTEKNITEISLSPGKICRRVIQANVGNTNGISVQIKIFQRNSGLRRMPIEKGRKLVEGGEVRGRLQDATSRTVCTTLQVTRSWCEDSNTRC